MMAKVNATITISGRITPEEKKQLDQYCEENHASISWVIREALRQLLNKQ